MEKTGQFVHLRLHSEYSLVDSVLRISDGEGGFCRVVRERGMPAVALTDLNNMFGAVRFYRAALSAGVKPILGADLHLAPEGPEARRAGSRSCAVMPQVTGISCACFRACTWKWRLARRLVCAGSG